MKKETFTLKSKNAVLFLMMTGVIGFYSQRSFAQSTPAQKTLPVQTDQLKEEGEDEDGERADRSMNCGGVERWAQKTLTDAAENTINFTPVLKTTTQLAALVTPTPSTSMLRTGPVETTTYVTHCNITIKKAETDADYHLVLDDGSGHTIIGEIPDPTCSAAAGSPYVNQFLAARNFIDAHIASGNVSSVNIAPVVVTGVGFVDPPHGQTGAAPNNLELHPIIDIHFEGAAGIQDMSKTLVVSVGPNPMSASTRFQVTSTLNNLGTCSLILYDMLGEEVKNVPVAVTGTNTLDYTLVKDDLKAGIYIYRLKNNGAPLYEGKLMVQ
jgi:hypothetical protein